MAWAIGLACPSFAQDSTAQKLTELLQAYYQTGQFNGSVLVARQGKILLCQGYGWKNQQDSSRNDGHTIYQIASVTKTFTATMILKLVELKKLSLTDKISRFYPGYPHGDSITIEHLLTHTSGIWNYTDDGGRLNSHIDKPVPIEATVQFFKDKPLNFAPGTDWSYSNSGYFLLGCIIQRVTGMTYEQAMRRYIFAPLGMKHSGFDFTHLSSRDKAIGYYADSTEPATKRAPVTDSTGPFAAGAIYSTVEDLYRWHAGLQAHRVLGPALLQKAYTPYKNKYGYGWILDSVAGKQLVSHSGGIFGFRSDFARVPADDVCVVLLSNTEMPGIGNITRRILALLYGKPYALPVRLQGVPLPEKILQRYTGTYRIEANGVLVEVALENGRLMARPHNGPPSELLALDETHFFLANEHAFKVYFESDETGKVVRMMVNPTGSPKPAPKIK